MPFILPCSYISHTILSPPLSHLPQLSLAFFQTFARIFLLWCVHNLSSFPPLFPSYFLLLNSLCTMLPFSLSFLSLPQHSLPPSLPPSLLLHVCTILIGRNRAKQIYNEEMKHGSSKRIITKVVLVGITGSGKSTSLETVMEEKPPAEEDRESTPLLKRSVQTEVINIDNHLKWIKKSPEKVRQHVAGLLRARARRLGKTSAAASDTASTATPIPATPTTVQSTPVQPIASTHHSSSATPLLPVSCCRPVQSQR